MIFLYSTPYPVMKPLKLEECLLIQSNEPSPIVNTGLRCIGWWESYKNNFFSVCLFLIKLLCFSWLCLNTILSFKIFRKYKWKWSHIWLFVTPWTVAYQDPPFMGFSRQEYWSGLLFPSPKDLSDPGIEPGTPTLKADSLPFEPPGKI